MITTTTNNNNFIRQSSSREEGWLETKMKRNDPWQRKWVVFDDGVLTCADSPQLINNIVDQDTTLSYGSGGSGGTDGENSNYIGGVEGQGRTVTNPSTGVMKIPMDQVISLRTDDQYGDSVIQIVTTEGKLLIRAPSKGNPPSPFTINIYPDPTLPYLDIKYIYPLINSIYFFSFYPCDCDHMNTTQQMIMDDGYFVFKNLSHWCCRNCYYNHHYHQVDKG